MPWIHFGHARVALQLLVEEHEGILVPEHAVVVVRVPEEHGPVHLRAGEVEGAGLLPQRLVHVPREPQLLLELEHVVYQRALLQRQAQELVHHPDAVLLRLRRPRPEQRAVGVRRDQRERGRRVQALRLLPVQRHRPAVRDGEAERAPHAALVHHEVVLQGADGERGVPVRQLEDVEPVGVHGDAEVVGEVADAVPEVVGEAEHRAAVVELREGQPAVGGEHEELPDGQHPRGEELLVDAALLLEERAHERREREVRDGAHGGAGEEQGVPGGGARDAAAAGEAELAVQLAGLGKGDAVRGREGGHEGPRAVEEAEGSVAVEDGVEGRHPAVGLGLDGRDARAVELLQELLAPLAREQRQERRRGFRGRGRRRGHRRRRRGWDGRDESSRGGEEAARHR